MAEKFVLDAAAVKSLAAILKETDLTEIEYEVGTHRIRVVREIHGISYAPAPHIVHAVPSAPPAPMEAPQAAAAAAAPKGDVITSPMVGTVYLASEPGAAPFIKVGSSVKQGDTLLIIEAMKVMNPIRATKDGKILDILAQDATPVEFGEPLVLIG
ncbi:Biotin carboxyl carrier protein [Candidatus Bealeia paramacronuclearis]|uniref:Biotin carboxyl carrier protein of acetyl-CoA carboxylase n=1 Tax=Candidatus Bealeia paramacronuclearis TaxID=1921001 RepID=A0ABZ2C5E0_9PROT|nr:Biotin carboxyl carrier protein [Candidatus Bealeia paramacronuclearis]